MNEEKETTEHDETQKRLIIEGIDKVTTVIMEIQSKRPGMNLSKGILKGAAAVLNVNL